MAVPADVSRALAKRGHVPVKGSVNGFPIRATLVPTGGGRHRLYINGEMRKGAGVGVGDEIMVTLKPDSGPRVTPIPEAFRKALEANKKAKQAFEKLPPSQRVLGLPELVKDPRVFREEYQKGNRYSGEK